MMYEKKCPVCGAEFTTTLSKKVYCGHQCAVKRFYLRGTRCGNYDETLEWKYSNGTWDCPYQENVGCFTRNCNKCGWNPEVAKARLDKIMGVTHEG